MENVRNQRWEDICFYFNITKTISVFNTRSMALICIYITSRNIRGQCKKKIQDTATTILSSPSNQGGTSEICCIPARYDHLILLDFVFENAKRNAIQSENGSTSQYSVNF